MAVNLLLELSQARNYIYSHPFKVAFLLLGAWFLTFLYEGYKIRKLHRNLPGPPHSWIFGHLKVMGEASGKLPVGSHPHYIPNLITHTYPELNANGVYFLDIWPVNYPMAIVTDGTVASQFTQQKSFHKHPCFNDALEPLGGRKSLALLEDDEWKRVRGLFSGGFAMSNLVNLVPMIVEETNVFLDLLQKESRRVKEQAKNGGVPYIKILPFTTGVTADIIGRAVFGMKLSYQTQGNKFMESVVEGLVHTRQSKWSPLTSELKRLIKIANSEARRLINAKILRNRKQPLGDEYKDLVFDDSMNATKVMLDLALQQAGDEIGKDGKLSEEFMEILADNAKMFVIAGHDTGASTLASAFYALSTHPEVFMRLNQELEEQLGPVTVDQAEEKILAEPKILNRMPYLTAFIKETLRLYPVAATIRTAPPGGTITDNNGRTHTLHPQQMLWPTPHLGSNPRTYGPTFHLFDPTRFLPDAPNAPPKDCYRPFEKGQRNCIGQELAMLELKIVTALTVRKFRFGNGYPEYIKREKVKKEFLHEGRLEVECGGVLEHYQVRGLTAKPVWDCPLILEEI